MLEHSSPFVNPLVVAMDVDSRDQALKLSDELSSIVGGIKLGPRLVNRYGQSLISEISKRSPVFVDCKFFDIPSTMVSAVEASFEAGASVVTVHALSGREALTELATLEKKCNAKRPFRILAVTILTSWSQDSLPAVMKNQPIAQQVKSLTELVIESGLSSVVCSAHELADLTGFPALYKLTPGIRFSLGDHGDQKRVMGPDEAIKAGANAIVVGRPIIEAKNPRETAMDFSVEVFKHLKKKTLS